MTPNMGLNGKSEVSDSRIVFLIDFASPVRLNCLSSVEIAVANDLSHKSLNAKSSILAKSLMPCNFGFLTHQVLTRNTLKHDNCISAPPGSENSKSTSYVLL